MSFLLLTTFLAVALLLLLRGLQRPGRVYEFSFLAGAVLLFWIGPQAIGLLGDTSLPRGGLTLTLFVATSCAAAIYLSHYIRPLSIRWANWTLDEHRLLWIAATLSVVGGFFTWKIYSLPNADLVGAWQGLPVLYLFFAKLQFYAFAISALLFARRRSKIALGVACFNFVFFLPPIFIGARRGMLIEVGLIVLLATWFGFRRALPRAVMMATLVLGTLFVFNVGQYRSVAYPQGGYGGHAWHVPDPEQVAAIDYWGALSRVLTRGAHEMRNAVYDIAAASASSSFNFGASYWNGIVQDYVPRQLVGTSLKHSLRFSLPHSAEEMYGHFPHNGTTHTGFSDSFLAFGLAGALPFLAIAWLMNSLYAAAVRDNMLAQLLYMALITDALHAITHSTGWFVSALPHVTLFLIGGCWLARARPQQQRDVRSRTAAAVMPIVADDG